MTVETQLKNLILEHYKSMLEFSKEIDMPYSTLQSVLKRGIGKAGIETVTKISQALGISADGLGKGKIIPLPDGVRYISDDDLKFALFHGEKMTDEDLQVIRDYAEFLIKKRKET